MSSSALAAGLRCLRGHLAAQERNRDCDEQLLLDFLNRRDDSAFAVLVHRHGPMVLHVCRRVLGHEQDAEDAFQATFLVLAQNAASLRNKSALAGFLHGTAYLTAMKAKQSAARRRKHERQTPPKTPADPADELSWREVRELLDEEIARLPEIYRSAFILCCLEDLNQTEAAQRLGLKVRTVSNRLAEARKRLAQRLARRGIELTGVLAAATLAAQPASALPIGLMATTIQAAQAIVTGEGVAGIVSATVAELVKGMTAAMVASKAKIGTVMMLAVSLLAGASAWVYHGTSVSAVALPAGLPVAQTDDKPPVDSPKRGVAKGMEIRGRVLGPDGKSKAGAQLLWLDEEDMLRRLGVSAADGSFTLAIPLATKKSSRLDNSHPAYLIAQCAGDGIDFLPSGRLSPENPVELRLVKDRVIRGRIINTEGKPVAGARVGVQSLYVYQTLDTVLAAWMKWHYWGKVPSGKRRLWTRAATLLAATTDADGRFVLHGAGDERYVSLSISGAGIADAQLHFINRGGFDPKPYNQAVLDNGVPRIRAYPGPELLYGPDFTFIAEAGKIIRGTVKAAETGEGRPGAAVWLVRLGDDLPQAPLQTKTDAQGRYEIRGIRKAKKYALQVPRDPAAGYMSGMVHVEDAGGYQPLAADITVKKGVIVTGKLIDRATGQALPGNITLSALADNPFAKDYAGYRHRIGTILFRVNTATDGTFRDVTIPGPVLLMGEADPNRLPGRAVEWLGFKNPIADPKYPQYFRKDPGPFLHYLGFNGADDHVRGACKVLDLIPGTEVVHQNIFMDRESERRIKMQDAQGQPLRGVWAMGLRPEQWQAAIAPSAVRLKDDSCPVYGLESGKARVMVFYEPEKKLAAVRTLHGDESLPAVVQLGPAGSGKGRLLDADGKPLAGVVLDVHYREEEAAEIHAVIHEAKRIVSDARGAFALDDLIPGLNFQLTFRRGKRRFQREAKPDDSAIQVKPGECRDLGAIALKKVAEKAGE